MTDSTTRSDSLQVTTDHPGGNGRVLEIEHGSDATTVKLEPETRDSAVRWFAWNVCLESDVAHDVTVEFPHDEVIGRWGPAVRRRSSVPESDSSSKSDQDAEPDTKWRWLGRDRRLDASIFTYSLEAGERVQFAFSFPYQRADLEAVASEHDLALETLTKTTAGRDVPLFRLGSDTSDRHLVIACRHHACESTASYMLEGVLRALCRDETDLLETYQLHVFPMVDIDGVERGDPGKHRTPHDHNRDYTTSNEISEFEPLYPSTTAIMTFVRELEGEVALGLDLHCPYKWGEHNDRPFSVSDPETAPDRLVSLATALERATRRRADGQQPTLTFDSTPGTGITTFGGAAGSMAAFSSFLWAEGATLAATLEVPYIGTDTDPVTPETTRKLGVDLARAVDEWLET